MNVFIIPSWYPSKNEPHTGIFFKEQAEALAHIFPESSFAISTWGSHDADLLLYTSDHFKNIKKLLKYTPKKPAALSLKPNLTEYYTPAFTWTRKLFSGNIKSIISANEKHLLSFQKEAGKVDIIHAHSAHPAGWVAMELSRKYNIPYIITEHMVPFPFEAFRLKSGILSPWLEKPLFNAFANIAVSPQQKIMLEQWNIPKITPIPNLTDESFFTIGEVITRPEEYTFFTLARLEESKGITYLLEAFKLLIQNNSKYNIRIGGEGSQQEKYKRLADKLGLNNHVKWLGVLNRAEALREYQYCDAFVLPSIYETFGIVCIEAMACGKPVISTYCGGPESIITPKTGLLVEPANVEALHQALLQLYTNRQRYNAQEIRTEFCNRYSRSVVCRQIMDVYIAASINNTLL